MFEKEAEDYAKKWILDEDDIRLVFESFKDGAEFGYKKGQSDQLVHKQYQLNQLRKANEWHDLRKNPQDLPDREGTFLVAIKYPLGGCESFILEYTTDEDDEEKLGWWDSEYTNFDNEVYAWREIPKPPKGDDA